MRNILLALLGVSIAGAALAEGSEPTIPTAATSMFTTASSFITQLETPLSAMMVAAFGIVIVFVAYKLAKRAINKV